MNPYPQQLKGAKAPQFQAVDGDTISQGITNNSVLKGIDDSEKNKNLAWILTLPIGGLLMWGMNKFNKACQGKYEDSVLGKVTAWGEKIGKLPFFQSDFMKSIEKGYSKSKTFINEKIINKSKILSAMFHTPSVPTNKMVLTMSHSTSGEVASEVATKFGEFTNEGKDLEKIKQLGFVKDGKADVEAYEKVIKNSYENFDKIIDICHKQGVGASFTKERAWKIPLTKKYVTDLIPSTKKHLCKEVHWSEFANKLEALKAAPRPCATTALGRALPKQMLRVIEGMTNGAAGGGKIGILMGAFFLADAVKSTVNAPKGEKGKTFAESNIYNLGWYLTMPLGIGLMHKAGGLQYIGMNKDEVAKYRKDLEAFNIKAKAGDFATHAEWKTAKAELQKALKGTSKWFHRPLKWAGRMLTVGLETVRPFKSTKGTFLSKTGNFFKNSKYTMKDWAGYPVRLGLFLFVISPFLAKFAAKASHVVFGRPTKSVLDDEKEKPKAEAPKMPVMPQASNNAQPPQPEAAPTAPPTSPPAQSQTAPQQQGGNLINMYNNKSAQAPQQAAPEAQKEAPKEEQEPVRKYIPSAAGVQIQATNTPQNSNSAQVNNAFSKADRAEQEALKYLKG